MQFIFLFNKLRLCTLYGDEVEKGRECKQRFNFLFVCVLASWLVHPWNIVTMINNCIVPVSVCVRFERILSGLFEHYFIIWICQGVWKIVYVFAVDTACIRKPLDFSSISPKRHYYSPDKSPECFSSNISLAALTQHEAQWKKREKSIYVIK